MGSAVEKFVSGLVGTSFCTSTIAKDALVSRTIQTVGRILPTRILGALHHQYVRI
jgi:hypothetical protein